MCLIKSLDMASWILSLVPFRNLLHCDFFIFDLPAKAVPAKPAAAAKAASSSSEESSDSEEEKKTPAKVGGRLKT